MSKDTEKYKQFEIEWITLLSIPWGGHGVEFHYKGERGILISLRVNSPRLAAKEIVGFAS